MVPTGCVGNVKSEAGSVMVSGWISFTPYEQESITAKPSEVERVVDILEGVVAPVERVDVEDEGRIQFEAQVVLLPSKVEMVAPLADIPVGTGDHQRETARTLFCRHTLQCTALNQHKCHRIASVRSWMYKNLIRSPRHHASPWLAEHLDPSWQTSSQ